MRGDFLALMSACAPAISLVFAELAHSGDIRAVRTEMVSATPAPAPAPAPTLGAEGDEVNGAAGTGRPAGSCADCGCPAREDATKGTRKVKRRAKKGARS